MSANTCQVYVIQVEGKHICKIGIAYDTRTRKKPFNTEYYEKTITRYVVEYSTREHALTVEGITHRQLKDKRLNGEWFKVSPAKAFKVIRDVSMQEYIPFNLILGNNKTQSTTPDDKLTYERDAPIQIPLNIQSATDIPAIQNGWIKDFVPLPSDPSIPLTQEQLDALFPPANRALFIQEMLKCRKQANAMNDNPGAVNDQQNSP